MKQSKILRRERAKARFAVLSYKDWCRAKFDKQGHSGNTEHADYSAYIERKMIEGKAIGLTLKELAALINPKTGE